nr:MAG TPA: hypothetical protein [Caudoviricetes sp.]
MGILYMSFLFSRIKKKCEHKIFLENNEFVIDIL